MAYRLESRAHWVSLFAVLAFGCGQGTSSNGSGSSPIAAQVDDASTDDDTIVDCTNDPRAMPYSAGLAVSSQGGTMTMTLLASDPGPPVRGTNAFTVRVTDATGASVFGATLTVTPTMPDHGHTTTAPTVVANADGTYTISGLYFFMDGIWQVSILTATDGGPLGTAVFDFCIEG
jgi:hypothetical protein